MAPAKKSLGEKILDTLANAFSTAFGWIQDKVTDALVNFILTVLHGLEQDYSKVLTRVIQKAEDTGEVPEEVKPLLEEVKNAKKPIGALLANAVGQQAAGATIMSVLNPLLLPVAYAMNRTFPIRILEPANLMAARWRGLIDQPEYTNLMLAHGWNETRAEQMFISSRPLLDAEVLRQLLLRGEITLPEYNDKLRQMGLDDTNILLLQKLHLIIPGAQDLIRMAVREVFSPEIVQRFGQMEDFPPEFASWGAKVGLSDFWARNYWAAHWDLPSVNQGFEMLHRGVIDQGTLELLLRALDVMPFWRDKLVNISYRPYTRVDVRRMFGLGVLDREGVKRSYLDLGYNQERAEKMTDFTVLYEAGPDRDLAKTELLDGYKRGILVRDRVEELLGDLGYSEDEVEFYLSREEVKKEQAYKDNLVDQYRKQYISELITREEAAQRLAEIPVPEERIRELLVLWDLEKETKGLSPDAQAERDLTRTDILDGYRKGLLTRDEAGGYLTMLGYDLRETDYLLEKVDYDKAREVKQLSLTTYKSLYTLAILDKTAVTSGLVAQGFRKEELEYLYSLWDIEKLGAQRLPSRTDLTRFLRSGIIGLDQFQGELGRLGYSSDHIGWYVQEVELEELEAARKEEERARKEADRVAAAAVKTKYEEDRARLDVAIAEARVFIAEKRYSLLFDLSAEEKQALKQEIGETQVEVAELQKEKAGLRRR